MAKDTNENKDMLEYVNTEISTYFDNLDVEKYATGNDMKSNKKTLNNTSSQVNKSKRVTTNSTDWVNPFIKAPFQYKEAFLSLRTNISFLSATSDANKLIVTSSIPGEGKTSIAVNLALALSSAGNTVLLIDADLRKPMVHRLLSIHDGTQFGLTNILRDKESALEGCIRHKVDGKGLSVIPCGIIPPNPTELLGSIKLGSLIEQLGEVYDFIILDTPPVSVVTDAAVLSQYADGILFVVRQKKVTFDQARQAKKNLETVDANILGVVINDFNIKHVDKSDSYYYSYYQYGRKKK